MISCADVGKAPEENTDTSHFTEETQTEEGLFDGFPYEKFNGQTFTVRSASINQWNNHYTEDLSGDIVNDTLLNRDMMTEELLDITVQTDITDSPNAEAVIKSVQAGDFICDAFYLGLSSELSSLVKRGILYDMNELDGLNLHSKYWNESMAEYMYFNGRLIFASGPISPMYLKSPIVTIFNKNLVRQHNIPDLYLMVREGRWTIDEFGELVKMASADLNGDGSMDTDNDRYGLTIEATFASSVYNSAGFIGVRFYKDGTWENEIGSQASERFISKCASILSNEKDIYIRPDGAGETHADVFADGRALFTDFTITGILDMFRSMDDDFGILPIPKHTEEQLDYSTSCNTWLPNTIAVPVTVSDNTLTGMTLEVMARYSYELLIPAVCDVTMEGKVSRDEESIEMLRMIYAKPTFDLNVIYNFGGSNTIVANSILGRIDNFVSEYESVREKTVAEIEMIFGD